MTDYEFYVCAYKDEELDEPIDDLTVIEEGTLSDDRESELVHQVANKLENGYITYGYSNCCDYQLCTVKNGVIVKTKSKRC